MMTEPRRLNNLLNGSHVLGVNNTYGPQWQRPLGATTNEGAVMAGRLVEFSGQFTF